MEAIVLKVKTQEVCQMEVLTHPLSHRLKRTYKQLSRTSKCGARRQVLHIGCIGGADSSAHIS